MTPGLVLRLALAEARHERRFLLLSAVGLAAVLAPLLVLLALKVGVVDVLLTRLLADPANREIKVALHGDYDSTFLRDLAERPEVAFLVPQTRALSATALLAAIDASPQRTADAELLPSAAGDPLLPAGVELGGGGIALSADLAERLTRRGGDSLRLIVARQRNGREERVFVDLTVVAVVERGRLGGRNALVPAALLRDLEDYRDDVAVAARGWQGSREPPLPEARRYSRFRLYATGLESVAPLADHLARLGVETVTRAADIDSVTQLNRSLSRIFAIVAGLGGLGYIAALAVSLWTDVERKRRTLALLRLLGLPRRALAALPLLQAGSIAVLGFLLAVGLYLLAAEVVNRSFAEGLVPGERLAGLPAGHIAAAFAVTLLVAMGAAALAARRAARIEPAEGLRDV
jgi:putative ABC transport system permease protein